MEALEKRPESEAKGCATAAGAQPLAELVEKREPRRGGGHHPGPALHRVPVLAVVPPLLFPRPAGAGGEPTAPSPWGPG